MTVAEACLTALWKAFWDMSSLTAFEISIYFHSLSVVDDLIKQRNLSSMRAYPVCSSSGFAVQSVLNAWTWCKGSWSGYSLADGPAIHVAQRFCESVTVND